MVYCRVYTYYTKIQNLYRKTGERGVFAWFVEINRGVEIKGEEIRMFQFMEGISYPKALFGVNVGLAFIDGVLAILAFLQVASILFFYLIDFFYFYILFFYCLSFGFS